MNESKLTILTDKLQDKAYILALNDSQLTLLNFLFDKGFLSNEHYHYFDDVTDSILL